MNNLTIIKSLIIVGLIGFLAFSLPAGAEEYEYIDISNPFLRKIPTAIPPFNKENTDDR